MASVQGDTGRPNLQQRMQNALRWRSWGGESDMPAAGQQGNAVSAKPGSRSQFQRGRSAGSDVELSALAINTSHSNPSDSQLASGLETGSRSLQGGSPNNRVSLRGQQSQGGSLVAEDLCSLATQAGSAVHSFTSLHSMLTDQSEGLDPAGTAAATAAPSGSTNQHSSIAAPSAPLLYTAGHRLSDHRGSDAGGDGASSVLTLPLISETGYEDHADHAEADNMTADSTRVAGFDDQEVTGDDVALHSIKPLVASSHGSLTSSTSEVSSTPAGAISILGSQSTGRSPYSSTQRSSSGGRQWYQQQQQQDGANNSNADLPMPFSTRKRPDNDETCSVATQVGSVHSISSILSSNFLDNSLYNRQSAASAGGALGDQGLNRLAGGGQQQHKFFHPLSSADGDATASASSGALDVYGMRKPGGVQSADLGSQPNCSRATTQKQPSFEQQRQKHQASTSDFATAATQEGAGQSGHSGSHHSSSGPERKGSLKGALRSVVAWGSGLSQRLHKATGSNHPPQQHPHATVPGSKSNGQELVGM